MVSEVNFLHATAAKLRNLAQREPAIAEPLRRLADQLDTTADDVKCDTRRPHDDARDRTPTSS